MSSWSSSYPPPPRRSRSRTPPRGGYSSSRGSYPDTYPEPQRPEWDSYDRDRWAYERDRNPYDYGRRRSRSPPLDEGMHVSLLLLLAIFLIVSLCSWQEAEKVYVTL